MAMAFENTRAQKRKDGCNIGGKGFLLSSNVNDLDPTG